MVRAVASCSPGPTAWITPPTTRTSPTSSPRPGSWVSRSAPVMMNRSSSEAFSGMRRCPSAQSTGVLTEVSVSHPLVPTLSAGRETRAGVPHPPGLPVLRAAGRFQPSPNHHCADHVPGQYWPARVCRSHVAGAPPASPAEGLPRAGPVATGNADDRSRPGWWWRCSTSRARRVVPEAERSVVTVHPAAPGPVPCGHAAGARENSMRTTTPSPSSRCSTMRSPCTVSVRVLRSRRMPVQFGIEQPRTTSSRKTPSASTV